ncbi:hypothetical protein FRC08_009967 [Ceratobasidium sp. 394]|nr:hypothetical protein FRC08_009967 [Ceratobasidium sp. 394]
MLLTSVGEGTMTLYCRHVIRAVREHGQECVVWPGAEEKEEIKMGFKKICGLDGIIGSLDGTLCGLATKPLTYKHGLTTVVNLLLFMPERDRLFAPGEILLADGGYTISPIVLTPFAKNELGLGSEGRRRREFNQKISRARIVVEWAFGRLKGRFPALKRLGAARDMKDIYRAIQAMMVLHNMCYQLGDAPDGLHTELDEEVDDESDSEDDDEQAGIDCSDMTHLEAGRAHRLHYLDILCPQ